MKHVLTFDGAADTSALTDVAALLFHNMAPGYAFVDDINHLYGLALARLDDLALLGATWPHYRFRDRLERLDYHLIERPQTSASVGAPFWSPGEKMLIMVGGGAADKADIIVDDFSSVLTPPESGDLAAEGRHTRLAAMHEQFTAVSALDLQHTPPTTSRKGLREHAEMVQFLSAIVDQLTNEEL